MHYANNCTFIEAVCHNCNKKGHLAKKCIGAKSKKQGRGTHSSGIVSHLAQCLQSTEQEEECSYSLQQVAEPRTEPIYTLVEVNRKAVKTEVDTGASASVISEQTYKEMWDGKQAPALTPAGLRLRTLGR
ncbi:hypothetical protein N1851_014112 [Merluccius polli]|uniref:CCHC-type domain-containing protein n=1 Tax=Merluccius polli TaxID=89951 RepID=A0AA47MTT4_MERPO|nr:hypothetical protein N1851_014112 [Merluccius polli]